MRPRNLLQLVLVKELISDVNTPRPPRPPRAHPPTDLRLVRVAPEQIAHRAVVRHVLEPVQLLDLLNGLDRRRKPSVGAENLFVKVFKQARPPLTYPSTMAARGR